MFRHHQRWPRLAARIVIIFKTDPLTSGLLSTSLRDGSGGAAPSSARLNALRLHKNGVPKILGQLRPCPTARLRLLMDGLRKVQQSWANPSVFVALSLFTPALAVRQKVRQADLRL